MCRNALVYNIEGSSVHENAVELDKLIINTAKQLDPTLELEPTVVQPESLEASLPPLPPQPKARKPRPPRKQEIQEEEEEFEQPDEDDTRTSTLPPDATNDSSLHKPSIGSDDANHSDVNSTTSSSPQKKKKRGVPPSRLPGATETRSVLIPKRSKKNTGEKMRPGRKSFNELRELYKFKLLEIYKAVTDLKVEKRYQLIYSIV
jgi:hypothetical protein